MRADTIQKSILEWLQLTPELLSGLPARARAKAKPVPAPAPARETLAAVPDTVDAPAVISPETVLCGDPGLRFAYPGASRSSTPLGMRIHPVATGAYNPIESGGNQRAALAEMTGYLDTALVPAPAISRR